MKYTGVSKIPAHLASGSCYLVGVTKRSYKRKKGCCSAWGWPECHSPLVCLVQEMAVRALKQTGSRSIEAALEYISKMGYLDPRNEQIVRVIKQTSPGKHELFLKLCSFSQISQFSKWTCWMKEISSVSQQPCRRPVTWRLPCKLNTAHLITAVVHVHLVLHLPNSKAVIHQCRTSQPSQIHPRVKACTWVIAVRWVRWVTAQGLIHVNICVSTRWKHLGPRWQKLSAHPF